jgi:hypothetical protein
MGGRPDPRALGMGEWGATYHYTVTIDNTGGSNRTATFETRNYDNMIYGYKMQGETYYHTDFNPKAVNSDSGWWKPTAMSISIPAHTVTTFEVVTMLAGGNGGTNNRIVLH